MTKQKNNQDRPEYSVLVDESEQTIKQPNLLFVSGPPRCGTTIVADLLMNHQEVAFTSENDLPGLLVNLESAFFKIKEHNSFLSVQAATVDKLAKQEYLNDYQKLAQEREAAMELSANKAKTKDEVEDIFWGTLKYIYSEISNKKAFKWIGDKMPNLESKSLHAKMPKYSVEPSYIFIFRDPLAMVASSNRRSEDTLKGLDDWEIDSVEKALNRYSQSWAFCRSLIEQKKRVLVLKYEDFITNDAKEKKRICDFLKISPFDFQTKYIDTPENIRAKYSDEATLKAVNRYFGKLRENWDKDINELIVEENLLRYCASKDDQIKFSQASDNDRLILESGFYPVDDWCVWGRKRSSLKFFLSRDSRPSLVNVHFAAFVSKVKPEGNVEILLNGVSYLMLNPAKISNEVSGTEITIPIPEGIESVTLDFINNRCKLPEDEPSGDTRELGIAFVSVKFQ